MPVERPMAQDQSGAKFLPRQCSEAERAANLPRLLVADDNYDMRQYLAHLLAGRHQVLTVPDGQAALEAARDSRPDLIICDVMMPRLDGIGLLRELRSDKALRTVPVILLSAREGEDSLVEGLAEGADDYLIKPFSGSELLARVAARLNLALLHKKSEEALRKSEERFRGFVTASSDWIFRMSPDGSEMVLLQRREVVLDKELRNNAWLEKYVLPDDRRRVLEAIAVAVRTRRPFELEHTILRLDGKMGWAFSRAVPLLDSEGKIVEWFGTVKDITDRKRYEEALRETEAEKSLILDNINEVIVFLDAGNNFIWGNRSYLKTTGLTLSELKGRKCYTAWGMDGFCNNCPVAAAIKTGHPQEADMTPANQPQWPAGCGSWNVRATPVKDSEGNIIGAIAIGSDITGIKRAEDELRVTQETLDAFFNAYPGIVTIKDEDFSYIKMGRATAAYFGLDSEKIAGKPAAEIAPDLVKDYGPVMRRVLETGVPEQGLEIKKILPSSEKTVYWHSSYFTVPLPGGKRGLGCVGIDITERKLAEQKLFETNQRLKALMDSLPVGVCFSNDPTCRNVTGNRAAQAQFEVGPEDNLSPSAPPPHASGRQVRFFKDGRQIEDSELPLNRAVAEKQLIPPTEMEVLLPSGRRWIKEASAAPIFDEEGNVTGGIAVSVDITERKKMEEELRELNQRLSYHVDHSPLAVIEWDADRRIIRWSSEAERMFGWRAEEVIGKQMDDFRWIYEEDRLQVEGVSNDLRLGTNPRRFSSNRNYRKEGSVIHCEWYNSSLLDDSGNLRSILSLVLDVTDRERMEEELRRSRDELEFRVQERTAALETANEKLRLVPSMLIEAQEKDRQRLASDLHDSIGQTLAALKFRIEYISDRLQKGLTEDAVKLLDDFVPILQRSLDETRTIYMGLKPTILSDHGILATLEWYRRQLMAIYPKIHIELEAEIEEEDIPEELKTGMFRIAQEALNNCCKHSNAEWVDLRLTGNKEAIEMEIIDEGIGMDLDYIMESTTANSLGLIGMRERAELTGGEFTIRSTEGEGTTVRIFWPRGPSALKAR